MKNLVDQYAIETTDEMDDGVVAIEYVVVAGAIVVALAVLWGAFGTALSNKLDSIVSSI